MTELQMLREISLEPVACALSVTPRMRYWKPARALAGLVSGYHLYVVSAPPGKPHVDVFQPASANLRILLSSDTEWRVRVGMRPWQAVNECSLFGPSSQVTWSESTSGIVVGAGITPLGWARLSKVSACVWGNRVGDWQAAFGGTISSLRSALRACSQDDALPSLLDSFLSQAMARPTRYDAVIAKLDAALLDDASATVSTLASRVGLTLRGLERLAAHAFGFAPNLLVRRARFLRSFHAIRVCDPHQRSTAIDSAYTDYSHFVRDAHCFLGMSPGAFLKLDMPLFRQSAMLRQQVLGAPAQALGPSRSASDYARGVLPFSR